MNPSLPARVLISIIIGIGIHDDTTTKTSKQLFIRVRSRRLALGSTNNAGKLCEERAPSVRMQERLVLYLLAEA